MDNITPKLILYHIDLFKVTKIAEPLFMDESSQGVCYGTTANWLEAVLNGKNEEQKVYDILNNIFCYIYQDSKEKKLPQKCISFAKKVARRQTPEAFSLKFIPQHKGHTLQPTKFNYIDIGIIAPNIQELENYLLEIESQLEALPQQPCIGFMIHANQHTVGLYYHYESKLWCSFNVSNLYPEANYHFEMDTKNLSKYLFFAFQATKENFLPLCVTVVSIAEYVDLVATLTCITDKFTTVENKKTSNEYNCFWLACYFGYNKLIKQHIDRQVLENVNVPISPLRQRYTPLYIACHNGHTATVKLLLATDAQKSINLTTLKGETPLYTASAKGHNEIVSLLLENDALTNINNELFIACQMGRTAIVSLLLSQKAVQQHINDLNPETHVTCLWVSCFLGHYDIIQILLKNGAAPSIHITDPNDKTPLSMAIDEDKTEIINLLSQYLPKNDGEFQEISAQSSVVIPQFNHSLQTNNLGQEGEKTELRNKIKFF